MIKIIAKDWTATFPDDFPKLVTGTCTVCGKTGDDFQLVPSKIICGDCKVAIGKRIRDGLHDTKSTSTPRQQSGSQKCNVEHNSFVGKEPDAVPPGPGETT